MFSQLSLKVRAFCAALLVLLVFIPLSAITLERAFTSSLSQAILEQLRVINLSLISEFELEDNQVIMPELLYNAKLNMPSSGIYGYVQRGKTTLWRSQSGIAMPVFTHPDLPKIGHERFSDDFGDQQDYFSYSYTAEFESESGYQEISFVVLQHKASFEAERKAFAQTLWKWLALLTVLLLLLLLFSLSMALKPINTLNRQIKQAESGEIARIGQRYPPELEKLKTSLNHLLDSEQQQRTRYKNSLGDLAHSLKTPLAVMSANEQLPSDAREPLEQINRIIERQLKRAVSSSGRGWEQAFCILPEVEKLIRAMHKVYRDKQLTIDMLIDPQHQFKGDETDLMELLGNLLDNACKAAQKRVKISTQMQPQYLQINIEDDGAGIPEKQRDALLTRGARLDTYTEGQGIGMAVVMDLVAAYQGQLHIQESDLGGARFQLRFKR